MPEKVKEKISPKEMRTRVKAAKKQAIESGNNLDSVYDEYEKEKAALQAKFDRLVEEAHNARDIAYLELRSLIAEALQDPVEVTGRFSAQDTMPDPHWHPIDICRIKEVVGLVKEIAQLAVVDDPHPGNPVEVSCRYTHGGHEHTLVARYDDIVWKPVNDPTSDA